MHRQVIRIAIPAVFAWAWAGCASSNQECDYVLFVPMHCVDPAHPLIASASTALPAQPVAVAPTVAPAPTPPVRSEPKPEPVVVAEPPAAPPPAPVAEPAPEVEVPRINVVYFSPGRDELSRGDHLTLEHIAGYLKQSKTEKVQLVAYTDPVGSAKKNLALAQRRAEGVVQQLATLGVEKSRVSILPPSLADGKNLAPTEYWRLRKTMVLYGPETMARVKTKEDSEEARLESELRPDAAPPSPAHPKDTSRSASKDNVSKDVTANKEADDKPKLETIDVIYWKNVTHGLFIIAKRAGFFEKEGFNVRLRESQLEANELNMQLGEDTKLSSVTRIPMSAKDVKSHRYFLGAVCPYGLHEALSEKLPFVQIGSMLTNPVTFLAKKEMVAAAQKNLHAFKGSVIARSKDLPNGFDSNFLLLDRLQAAGMKEGVDYTIKAYDNDNFALAALVRGEVTVMTSNPPNDLDFVKKHPDFGFFPVSSLNMNLPCCRQVVTRDNLKRNKDKYVRFERAVLRAERSLREHPDESIEILAKFLNMAPATVRSILQRPGFALTANPNTKGSMVFADVMAKRLGKAKIGDVRESIDTSVYEEALLGLMKTEPSPAYNEMLAKYRGTR